MLGRGAPSLDRVQQLLSVHAQAKEEKRLPRSPSTGPKPRSHPTELGSSHVNSTGPLQPGLIWMEQESVSKERGCVCVSVVSPAQRNVQHRPQSLQVLLGQALRQNQGCSGGLKLPARRCSTRLPLSTAEIRNRVGKGRGREARAEFPESLFCDENRGRPFTFPPAPVFTVCAARPEAAEEGAAEEETAATEEESVEGTAGPSPVWRTGRACWPERWRESWAWLRGAPPWAGGRKRRDTVG